MDLREKRKWDHLKYSLELSSGPLSTGFSDLYLVHQALGTADLDSVDTGLVLFGKKIRFPLIINAMTGGARGLEVFNKRLAIAARECGIPLAVGSQTAAIKNPDTRKSFEIVRKMNPQGLVFANLSALIPYQQAREAVEMIEADALQLHLNLPQELAMPEGDRDFSKLEENIYELKEKIQVPLIIKEVGFGLSRETVLKLRKMGINYVDVGGAGGTNFVAIERVRSQGLGNEDLLTWGIPTAVSLIETLSTAGEMIVFASGGINKPSDILKSLVLGAKAVGMAASLLEVIYENEEKVLIDYLEDLFKQVKELMLLIGTSELKQLKKCPIIITGFVREWLEARGINIQSYAYTRE